MRVFIALLLRARHPWINCWPLLFLFLRTPLVVIWQKLTPCGPVDLSYTLETLTAFHWATFIVAIFLLRTRADVPDSGRDHQSDRARVSGTTVGRTARPLAGLVDRSPHGASCKNVFRGAVTLCALACLL